MPRNVPQSGWCAGRRTPENSQTLRPTSASVRIFAQAHSLPQFEVMRRFWSDVQWNPGICPMISRRGPSANASAPQELSARVLSRIPRSSPCSSRMGARFILKKTLAPCLWRRSELSKYFAPLPPASEKMLFSPSHSWSGTRRLKG